MDTVAHLLAVVTRCRKHLVSFCWWPFTIWDKALWSFRNWTFTIRSTRQRASAPCPSRSLQVT